MLEAEAVRDSLLAVAGVLDQTRFGPGTLDPASRRRSVYFTVKRSQMVGAMQSFDAPEPLVSQGTRPTTTVAPCYKDSSDRRRIRRQNVDDSSIC